jgi:hypothetical protein
MVTLLVCFWFGAFIAIQLGDESKAQAELEALHRIYND